jgi:hypothetical protein
MLKIEQLKISFAFLIILGILVVIQQVCIIRDAQKWLRLSFKYAMEKRQIFYQILISVINNELLKTERGMDTTNKFLGKIF